MSEKKYISLIILLFILISLIGFAIGSWAGWITMDIIFLFGLFFLGNIFDESKRKKVSRNQHNVSITEKIKKDNSTGGPNKNPV